MKILKCLVVALRIAYHNLHQFIKCYTIAFNSSENMILQGFYCDVITQYML